MDSICFRLDWLGPCKREPASQSMHPLSDSRRKRRLIRSGRSRLRSKPANTRACSPSGVIPLMYTAAGTAQRWNIVSFEPVELFGTKLRPILPRRKNPRHGGPAALLVVKDRAALGVVAIHVYVASEVDPNGSIPLLKSLTRSTRRVGPGAVALWEWTNRIEVINLRHAQNTG